MSVRNKNAPAAPGGGRDESVAGKGSSQRRAYSPPGLTRFGDVRGITLGGSPGGGDSGAVGNQFPRQ